MADRSKFTDEEWVERSYRKTVKRIVDQRDRETKLSQRLQEKTDHLAKRDKDIERVEKYKLDKKGFINIPLEDGSTKTIPYNKVF